jgi:hypothetical protein
MSMPLRWSVVGGLLLWVGCASDPLAPSTQRDAASGVDAAAPDATGGEASLPIDGATTTDGTAAADAAAPDAAAPKTLPFSYTRPGVGTPVPADELAAITDKYLDVLQRLRYFELVDERVHGWPRSDPQQRYWYGTWWSGVTVVKENGRVSYVHGPTGADNNGLRMGPLLEGSCFAHLLWGGPLHERLARKMFRGVSAWFMAMERHPNDPDVPLQARSFFPPSIASTDDGLDLFIDYDQGRPGQDGGASSFVHVAANPYWGDIWIKNKRSKDDVGHMLRAIAQLDNCSGRFADPATQQDLDEMVQRYAAWARRIEDDNWSIATLNKEAQLWIPPETLAHFTNILGAECDAMLSLRLLGRGDPASFDCANGISILDDLIGGSNDHNAEILRSFHESAVHQALLNGQPAMARALLEGLALRVERGMERAESGDWPESLESHQLVDLIVHAGNAGLPLTWREVRWVHGQIEQAHESFPVDHPMLRVFDPATPDGTYPYAPYGSVIRFRSLGLLLGSCVAQYRNPASKPLLDCPRVKAATP